MQDCVTGRVGKTIYGIGNWVKTLDPIYVGVAYQIIFLLIKC